MPNLPGLTKPASKINAAAPIVAADDAVTLLAQIRDLLSQVAPSGQSEDYTNYADVTLSAAAGSLTVRPDGQYGYVYFPDAPRELTVWSGSGRARLLGVVSQGSHASLQIPKGQELLIEYGAGSDGQTLSYWVSSRPITYQALNPDLLTMAAAAGPYHLEDSPHASGDGGALALAVASEGDTILNDTNLDYIPIATNRLGYVLVSYYATVIWYRRTD